MPNCVKRLLQNRMVATGRRTHERTCHGVEVFRPPAFAGVVLFRTCCFEKRGVSFKWHRAPYEAELSQSMTNSNPAACIVNTRIMLPENRSATRCRGRRYGRTNPLVPRAYRRPGQRATRRLRRLGEPWTYQMGYPSTISTPIMNGVVRVGEETHARNERSCSFETTAFSISEKSVCFSEVFATAFICSHLDSPPGEQIMNISRRSGGEKLNGWGKRSPIESPTILSRTCYEKAEDPYLSETC